MGEGGKPVMDQHPIQGQARNNTCHMLCCQNQDIAGQMSHWAYMQTFTLQNGFEITYVYICLNLYNKLSLWH